MTASLRVYYDADADHRLLDGRTFAIIGYGGQDHAHVVNLSESGAEVVVGLRRNRPSWDRARAAGLEVETVEDAASAADVVMMLVPDQDARSIYEDVVV